MKPPACVSCKWGQGTVKDKQPDTQTAKEIESNLNKILFERAQQDKMWGPSDTSTHTSVSKVSNFTHTSAEQKRPSKDSSSLGTK